MNQRTKDCDILLNPQIFRAFALRVQEQIKLNQFQQSMAILIGFKKDEEYHSVEMIYPPQRSTEFGSEEISE